MFEPEHSQFINSINFFSSPTEPSLDDIDADPELRLLEQEPDLWVHTVDKEVCIMVLCLGQDRGEVAFKSSVSSVVCNTSTPMIHTALYYEDMGSSCI